MTLTHEHECRKCHTRWSHGDDKAADRKAHTCPGCGYIEWTKRPLSGFSEWGWSVLLCCADRCERIHDDD